MRDETVHAAIEPMLIEYTAGVLDASSRANVEAHLASCDQCRRALAEWRQIGEAARTDVVSPLLPPLDWQRIRSGDMPRVTVRPSPSRRFAPVALLATFIVVAFLAALALRPPQEPEVAQLLSLDFPTPTNARPGLPTQETVLIVVAKQDIPNRKVINMADVELAPWPVDITSRGVFFTLDDVLGKIALYEIRADLPLLTSFVTSNARDLVNTPSPENAVVVAARPIPLGAVIAEDDVDVREWPPGTAPEGVFRDPAEVIGSIALGDFTNGMALTAGMVASPELAPEATAELGVSIVVAARALPAGHVLQRDDLITRVMPPGFPIADNAVLTRAAAIGRTLTQRVDFEQWILTDYLGAPGPTSTPLPTIDIVVAAQRINRGQVINAADLDYREWPERYAPLSAITDTELVIGTIARTDIEREQPILSSHITDNLNDLGSVSVITRDRPLPTIVTIPRARVELPTDAVEPGDRVDVFAVAEAGAASTNAVSIVIRGALLAYIGTYPDGNEETVSLSLLPEEAERLEAVLAQNITIRLMLVQPIANTELAPETTPETTMEAMPEVLIVTGTPEPAQESLRLTVSIVVALEHIYPGEVVKPHQVGLRTWPAQSVPLVAMFNLEDAIGQYALTDIAAHIPISPTLLTDDEDTVRTAIRENESLRSIEIVVARRIIRPNQIIVAEDVRLTQYPINLVPFYAIRNLDQVIGMVALEEISEYGPVLLTHIADRVAAPQTTHEATDLVSIVVALQPIGRGQVIQASDIGYRVWPEPVMPQTAITDTELVIGTIARTDIERDQPILTSMLIHSMNELTGETGCTGSAILPPGTRLIALPRAQIDGTTLPRPGGRVDVVAVVNVEGESPREWTFAYSSLVMCVAEDVVAVTVTPDEAGALDTLIAADVLFRLVLAE